MSKKVDEEIVYQVLKAADGTCNAHTVREAIRLAREDSAAYHDEWAAHFAKAARLSAKADNFDDAASFERQSRWHTDAATAIRGRCVA